MSRDTTSCDRQSGKFKRGVRALRGCTAVLLSLGCCGVADLCKEVGAVKVRHCLAAFGNLREQRFNKREKP